MAVRSLRRASGVVAAASKRASRSRGVFTGPGVQALRILGKGAAAGSAVATAVLLAAVVPSAADCEAVDIVQIDEMHRQVSRFSRQTVYDYLCELTATDFEMDRVMLQWRKARAAYELAMLESTPREKRESLLREAKHVLKRCTVVDRNSGEMRRWLGLVIVALAEFQPVAEQVSASYDALDQWRQAVEIDPADAVAHHLLGCWSYDQAAWSWYYRWWVSTMYAEPPSADWMDAKDAFASAERIAPGSWKKNQLMLARTYAKMGDYGRAAQWCARVLNGFINSREDEKAHKDAVELLTSLDPDLLKSVEEDSNRKLELAEVPVSVEERTDGYKGESAPPVPQQALF